MVVEQRRYMRFSVQDNAFAALRGVFGKVGKLNDISKKGLAFSYLIEYVKGVTDKNYSEVDIFLAANNFYLDKVPCKIVYEIQAPNSDKNYSIMKHRCGLQFGELSISQSQLLELFLENYTTRPL